MGHVRSSRPASPCHPPLSDDADVLPHHLVDLVGDRATDARVGPPRDLSVVLRPALAAAALRRLGGEPHRGLRDGAIRVRHAAVRPGRRYVRAAALYERSDVLHARPRRSDAAVCARPHRGGDRGGRGVRRSRARHRVHAGPLSIVLAPRDGDHAARRARGLAAERGGAAAWPRCRSRPAHRAAARVGALVRGRARVTPVVSGALLLPLSARQSVVARGAHHRSRHERAGVDRCRGRLPAAGTADVRDGAPHGRRPRPGPRAAADHVERSSSGRRAGAPARLARCGRRRAPRRRGRRREARRAATDVRAVRGGALSAAHHAAAAVARGRGVARELAHVGLEQPSPRTARRCRSARGRLMERRRLGRTDMSVSALGFGGSEIGYEGVSQSVATRLLNAALDAGLNVIDTAQCYADSETLIGRAVGGRRREFHLFTKVGHAGGWGREDWRPPAILKSIERSLTRLRTDAVDLVQLHSCSERVLRRGDAITALETARQRGLTRYIGYSGDGVAARYAVETGRFDTLQISLSIADQAAIEMVLPAARERDVGVIAKRPVANVSWRSRSRPPAGAYHRTYWERLRALDYDF